MLLLGPRAGGIARRTVLFRALPPIGRLRRVPRSAQQPGKFGPALARQAPVWTASATIEGGGNDFAKFWRVDW
jgi:hypothetical protein